MIAIVLGLGLALNCARALFSPEGKYDAESRETMLWSNLVGIVLGLAAAGWGVWLLMHRLSMF